MLIAMAAIHYIRLYYLVYYKWIIYGVCLVAEIAAYFLSATVSALKAEIKVKSLDDDFQGR